MFIKRILILTLLMIVICSFSACDNSNNDTDQISDNNNLITDTIIDTNTDNEDNSEVDSTSTDDLNTDTSTDDIKEAVTEYGNFTTLHKTIPSNDRMKQMRNSKAVFNTGSKYTPDELKNTKLQAIIISSAKIFFPNASDFMDHYLNGAGENYELDVENFLEDKTAKENMLKDLNAALRAAENMAVEGEKITIYQNEESLYHNLTGDWKYSVGSYFASVELYDVKETTFLGVACYTAKFKYVVQDFYNWDENDTNNVSITSVSPADLHQLHVNGDAQEFLTYGEEEYQIKWAKGAEAASLNLDKIDD